MTNIYCIYCILAFDHNKKENLIVSSSKERIELPIFKIDHPRSLSNELRYNIKNILLEKTYNKDIIKNISFTYTDIQNDLILGHIEKNYKDQYNLDEDIFIFCGVILENLYPLNNFEWYKFDFIKSIADMDSVTSIIDFTIQKSIL